MVDIKVDVGDRIPDIPLDSYPGPKKVKLSDFRGKWVVLYFYPRDDTPGCTKEACGFRDSLESFKGLEAEVVGVSTDDLGSHRKFAAKHRLNFTLLSDPNGELGSKLGTLKEGGNSMRRVTFLIDPAGYIRRIYPRVDPTEHPIEVMNDLKALKSQYDAPL